MITAQVPASRCDINCRFCGMPTNFLLFEPSGPGGDFATYVGMSTGNLYRLDLGQVHYLGKSLADLLLAADEVEGGSTNLCRIPDQLKCASCGADVSSSNIIVGGDEQVAAVLL